MAKQDQLEILKQGVDVWNRWRAENPDIQIDLARADLCRAKLKNVNFYLADLRGSKLREADLKNADLGGTDLSKADLSGADIRWANISEANWKGANLSGANLAGSNLSETNFESANLTGCHVYAISAWNLRTNKNTKQSNLVITRADESTITVDNIKVAQFIYLILKNEEIREAINTITSKSVLILGRFSIPERKAVLEALKNKLREYNLVPIVFDFERPTNKDFTETIKTLAGLSYFVIADVTNPRSAPLELQASVPDYQIPFVPIIQEGEEPFSMMANLQSKYKWVLKTRSYDSIETLMKALKPRIIDPAVKMHFKLRRAKARKQEIESLKNSL
jgi:uncharacterized protein YjbI with pentapeptide repeats